MSTVLPLVLTETVIAPDEVARQLAVTHRTATRWMTEGFPVGGRVVRLEAEWVGGRLRTSLEAVARFVAACREARTPPPAATTATPGKRRKQSRDDRKALERMGIKIN